jgi:hypothetical protein
MRHSIIPFFALLSACASIQPQSIRGPNGKPAYAMECSGFGRTLQACYAKAGEVCANGYTIVDKATGTIAVPINGSIMAAPQNSLVVECK